MARWKSMCRERRPHGTQCLWGAMEVAHGVFSEEFQKDSLATFRKVLIVVQHAQRTTSAAKTTCIDDGIIFSMQRKKDGLTCRASSLSREWTKFPDSRAHLSAPSAIPSS